MLDQPDAAILASASIAAVFFVLVVLTVRVMRWIIVSRHPEIDRSGQIPPTAAAHPSLERTRSRTRRHLRAGLVQLAHSTIAVPTRLVASRRTNQRT